MKYIYILFLFLMTITFLSGCTSKSKSKMVNVDVLITHAHILTMDEKFTEIKDGCVAINQGNIVYVGSICSSFEGKVIKDGTGQILLPGFINLHTHVAMTAFKESSLAQNTDIEKLIMPIETRIVDDKFLYWGSLSGINELLSSGVTTFIDNYYGQAETAKAVKASGIRAILGETFRSGYVQPNLGAKDSFELFERLRLASTENSRLRPAFAALILESMSMEDRQKILGIMEKEKIPLMLHAAEMKEYYKADLVDRLISSKLMIPGSIIAHGTYFTKKDFEKLKRNGLGMAINPTCNIKRAGRAVNFWDLHDSGVAYGFGTDGTLVTGSLSMLLQLKMTSLLSKMQDPKRGPLPARDILAHATSKAAEAANLSSIVGQVKAGLKADLIFIDKEESLIPDEADPYESLLNYGAIPVVSMTMVDGDVLYENKNFKVSNSVIKKELKKIFNSDLSK
jgi:5-methylthioadenosine/S-adenosylhomocysteine deaminase